MSISIEEGSDSNDIEATIRCGKADRRVLDIIAKLRMLDRKVTGFDDEGTHIVAAGDVLYVESVDRRTFFYTKDGVYETSLRLYELADELGEGDFVRASKSAVVNLSKVVILRPEANGRLLATLENGERLTVSRQYTPVVKEKLGIR